VHATLDAASRSALGQTIHFPSRRFSKVEVRIDGVYHVPGKPYNGVGFQEIRIADHVPYAEPLGMQELARLPVDLLKTLGTKSLDHPLSFVLARDAMDDSSLARQIWLPTDRAFSLSGTVSPGARASDTELDRLFGIPDASAGGVTASSDEHYGDVLARASSAIDHDPLTAWTTPMGKGKGSIEITVPDAITFDHLDLKIVDDGRHSVPTELRVEARDGVPQTVNLTELTQTRGADGTVSMRVPLKPVRGDDVTFEITKFRPASIQTADHPEGILLPSAIAELGIPGVTRPALPKNIPATCVDDLLQVDGQPFPVRISGTTQDALQGRPLKLSSCDGKPVRLTAGTHEIEATESPISPSGADVDHLALASGPGGHAVAADRVAEGTDDTAPDVRVVSEHRTAMKLEADASSQPYWLVLGQSVNRGWHAEVDGHDLGESTLVDGYANGWLVPASTSGKPATITLEWTPQKSLRIAFLVSLLAALACLAIVIVAFARGRKRLAYVNAPAPVLRGLLHPRPLDRSRRGAVIGTVVASTLLAGLLVKPWVGPVVGVLVYLAIRSPRGRTLLRVVPATLVGAVAIYVTWTQIAHNYPAVFQWPSYFDDGRVPAWIAVVLVACDALIAVVWRTEVDEPPEP
jgi:arabinofuranan 3-O-arabinosyltransferase